MASTLITTRRKRGIDPNRLNVKHRQFADEYLANGMVGAAAARAVGYKNPAVMACKLLRHKLVRAYIESELDRITEGRELRKLQLVAKMQRVNDFNLMLAAGKSKNGFIEIDVERYEQIAEEIGDAVTEIECETIEQEDGRRRSKVRIKLMSKDKMHELEMRYYQMLIERSQVDGNVNVGLAGILPQLLAQMDSQDDGIIDAAVVEAKLEQDGDGG